MINVFNSWRDKRNQRRTHRELSRLSNHLLADIGINRADLFDHHAIRDWRGDGTSR
jgi:uncharacterized protein YjiS (DUF1127 family)